MIKIFIVEEDELEATHNRDMVASAFYSSLERAGTYPRMGMYDIHVDRHSDGRAHLCLGTRRLVPGCLNPDDILMFMTMWEYAEWAHWFAPCDYQIVRRARSEDIEACKQAYNLYAYEDYAEDD